MRGLSPRGPLTEGKKNASRDLEPMGRDLGAHELFLPYRSVGLVGWDGVPGGSLGDHVEGSSRLWRVRQEL